MQRRLTSPKFYRAMGTASRYMVAVVAVYTIASAILFVRAASADAPVSHATFVEWVSIGDKLMTATSSIRLPTERDLNVETGVIKSLRDGVTKMKAHLDTLTPDDQHLAQAYAARVEQWTGREETAVAAEAAGRPIVTSLCDATNNLASLKADLARERANPSGVVNLSELNRIGSLIQVVDEQIKGLTPGYVAFRHHAFTGWQSEAVCVVANEQ
jgi:hypothetical protein